MDAECAEAGCTRKVNAPLDGAFCVDHKYVKDLRDPGQLDPRKMSLVDAKIALTFAIHRACDIMEKKR